MDINTRNILNNTPYDIIELIYTKSKQNIEYISAVKIQLAFKNYKRRNYYNYLRFMVECDNCGNIWDGNAQCYCFGI